MKLVFFGSDKFAAGILRYLLARGYRPDLVVTVPPAPAGRGFRLKRSIVDKISEEAQIKTERPSKLKESSFVEKLRKLKPDLLLVVDYGRILPMEILKVPRSMSLAIHPSLLPLYRGSAPINWVLINGENKTGVTIFRPNEALDSGDIILQREVKILPDDDYSSLFQRLLTEACVMTVLVFEQVLKGKVTLKKQDDNLASFAPKIDRDISRINWQKEAQEIYNLVRGLRGDGEAWCLFRDQVFKIKRVLPLAESTVALPGSIVYIDKSTLKVAASDRNLKLEELKPAGRNFMDIASFIAGYAPQKGERFT